MKVFIFLCILTATFADQGECPENEHFKQCGSACPSTCNNFHDLTRPCVEMCVAGCFCDEGLVRNENDLCVTSEKCPPACEQQKLSGPCTAVIRRFYFNNETTQCEQFIYGGCEGNRNNFLTKEECEIACID